MRLVTTLLVLATLALAGCATPDNVQPAATGDSPTLAATAAPMALKFDGVTPAYAEGCVATPAAGQCGAIPPNADFSKTIYQPTFAGTPSELHISVSWTSVSPANDQMTLVVQDRDANGVKTLAYKEGASPLTIDLAKITLKGKLSIVLGGMAKEEGAQGVGAGGSGSPMDQPWKLTGNLTVTPK